MKWERSLQIQHCLARKKQQNRKLKGIWKIYFIKFRVWSKNFLHYCMCVRM